VSQQTLNALIKSNPDQGTVTIASTTRASKARLTSDKHWLNPNRDAPACRANTATCAGDASTVNRNAVCLPTNPQHRTNHRHL
jgi:hypothetical protein